MYSQKLCIPKVPWMKLYRTPERETTMEIGFLKFLCLISFSFFLLIIPILFFSKTTIIICSIILLTLIYLIVREKLFFKWINTKRRIILNRERTNHRAIFQSYRDNITCCKRSYDAAMEFNDRNSANAFLCKYKISIIKDLEKRYGTKIE